MFNNPYFSPFCTVISQEYFGKGRILGYTDGKFESVDIHKVILSCTFQLKNNYSVINSLKISKYKMTRPVNNNHFFFA